MVQIAKWENVPHAIDIGNSVKAHYRQFSWFARGNILRTEDHTIDSEHVKQIIVNIINKDNETHILAKENDVQNLS